MTNSNLQGVIHEYVLKICPSGGFFVCYGRYRKRGTYFLIDNELSFVIMYFKWYNNDMTETSVARPLAGTAVNGLIYEINDYDDCDSYGIFDPKCEIWT